MIGNGELPAKSVSLQAITIPPQSGQSPKGLIVILHGWGASAQDVAFLCSLLKLPNIQFMVPDAPFSHPYSTTGRMWYDLSNIASFRSDISQQPDLKKSRQLLIDWLKSLEASTGIPLSRTILGGFSQGGAMTLDVGTQLPLAGLMVMSGYLHSAISRQPSYPPILLVHGRQDSVVPLSAGHFSRQQLTAIGAKVDYKEFDMGHEVSPLVLNEAQQFVEKILL
ncbi:MAG: alpha/beta hydrolase [Myxacorys californica WJT36-NPBG1]|nr:alpha/beta hydrolase [Myxacorys californica WJT36-NPBG1]